MGVNDKRIEAVAAGDGRFTLELVWSDGVRQVVDLSGLVVASRHFRRFLDEPEAFADVRIVNWGHGVAWANGLDYAAESLARIADEQTERDGREVLLRWQSDHGLTNEEAGQLLGYRKSQIKNFRSGISRVPTSVVLAMRAFDADPTMFYAHYRPDARSLARERRAG